MDHLASRPLHDGATTTTISALLDGPGISLPPDLIPPPTVRRAFEWVHGTIVQIEFPSRPQRIDRKGWGTKILQRSPGANWFHLPITTPAILDGQAPELAAVVVLLRTHYATVTNVHLYDGTQKFASFDGLTLTGDHVGGIDDENVWVPTPRRPIQFGLGISVRVAFTTPAPDDPDNDSWITFGAAGAESVGLATDEDDGASPPAALTCVDNVAALRVLPGATGACVDLLGYHLPGDGGGGLFHWDDDATTPDDGGIVFAPTVASPPGRWRRIDDGPISVRWYGAVADWNGVSGPGCAGTDNRVAFQRALATTVAAANASAAKSAALCIPAGAYLTRRTGVDDLERLFHVTGKIALRIFGAGRETTIIKFENGDEAQPCVNSWDFFNFEGDGSAGSMPSVTVEDLTTEAPHRSLQVNEIHHPGVLLAMNHYRLAQVAAAHDRGTFVFRRLRLRGGNFGIRPSQETIDTVVEDCIFQTINDGIHQGFSTPGIADPAYRVNYGSLVVRDCVFDTNYPLDIEPGSPDWLANVNPWAASRPDNGHGMLIMNSSRVNVVNSRFLNQGSNRTALSCRANAEQQNGAPAGHHLIANCTFECDPTPGSQRGVNLGINASSFTPTSVVDCTFTNRNTGIRVGTRASLLVDGCRFALSTTYAALDGGKPYGAIVDDPIAPFDHPNTAGVFISNCVFEYQPGDFGYINKDQHGGAAWRMQGCRFVEAPELVGNLTGVVLSVEGDGGATSYGYVAIPTDADGNVVGQTGPQAIVSGNAVLDTSNRIMVQIYPEPKAHSYDIYRIVDGTTQGKIGTLAADVGNVFYDTGQAADSTAYPTSGNTTFHRSGQAFSASEGSRFEFVDCLFDLPKSRVCLEEAYSGDFVFRGCTILHEGTFRFLPSDGDTQTVEFTDCYVKGGSAVDFHPTHANGAVVVTGENNHWVRGFDGADRGPGLGGAGSVTGYLRVKAGIAPVVASAAAIEVSCIYDTQHVTGTTPIETIIMPNGAEQVHYGPIRLIADDPELTVKHGIGNIRLKGGADAVLAQHDTLSLFFDSTVGFWYEA